VKKKHRKLIRRYAAANSKPVERLVGLDWGLAKTLREIRELPEVRR